MDSFDQKDFPDHRNFERGEDEGSCNDNERSCSQMVAMVFSISSINVLEYIHICIYLALQAWMDTHFSRFRWENGANT